MKQIHRLHHIYDEFDFFSFYCFNSCIVLENLYKTFWSIIETFWSGRGARSVRYVIGRRKILFILVPNLYLSRRTSCMNILYFYHLDDFTFESAVPRWPRTAISSLVAFYFKFLTYNFKNLVRFNYRNFLDWRYQQILFHFFFFYISRLLMEIMTGMQ